MFKDASEGYSETGLYALNFQQLDHRLEGVDRFGLHSSDQTVILKRASHSKSQRAGSAAEQSGSLTVVRGCHRTRDMKRVGFVQKREPEVHSRIAKYNVQN